MTGRPPFAGDSPLQIAYRHLEEAPAAPDAVRQGIPEGLSAVILRCLAKHPGERYRRAEELGADLPGVPIGRPAPTGSLTRHRTRVLRHDAPAGPSPPAARRGLRWALGSAGAAAIVAAVVAAVVAWPEDAPARRGGQPRPVRAVTDLSADGSCAGWLTAEVALTWSPTGSRFADGYDVYRATRSGGQYDLVAFVPGRDSTWYADGDLGLDETYYYVVKATAGRRESRPIQTQAETPLACVF